MTEGGNDRGRERRLSRFFVYHAQETMTSPSVTGGTINPCRLVRTLRTIDAAEDFAVAVSQWLRSSNRSCAHADQLRRAADSVSANLIDGYGRGPGADRLRLYRIGKAECEEALGWLRKSRSLAEIAPKDFHRLSNRGIVIVRMINALMN
jgi:four helix bundle protein